MELVFVIELILGLIFVALAALLTLQDLHTQYLCEPTSFADDDDDGCAAPHWALRD
jgi:hypothetical protein